jgi:hypothetical protein
MQIRFRIHGRSEILTLDCEAEDTIDDIKRKLLSMTQIPVDRQILHYNGRV